MPFDFHFMRPLWLLLLLPLAAVLWRLYRTDGDSDAWRGVVDAHLLPRLLVGETGAVQRLPLILLGVGWVLLVLAVAGPTWQRLPQPLFQAQQYRVIALDLSPTMNSGDLKPTRLAHARYEVLDLLRAAGEGQTALIAYGAEPYIVSPLTADTATIAAQVPLLDTGLLPVMGARRTDLALTQAAELLRQAGVADGEVILVTDAVEPVAAAADAARAAHAAGYRVSVLGIGTAKGAPIALPGGGFVKDKEGAIVLPRLDAEALEALADAGGGRYVAARLDDRDIEALLPAGAARLGDRAQKQDASSDQWREEGPWLLLLLLPLAALAFRRGWLSPLVVLVLVLPAPDAYAVTWDGLWLRPDQQAQRQLEAGQAAEAATLFERSDWRAAAHYQAGDYAQALASLEGQEVPAAAYNRGNTLARLGRLEDAVSAYDQALATNPSDEDAHYNRNLVQGLLDRQRRQQQQAAQEGPRTQDAQRPPDAQSSQDEQKQEQSQQAEDQQSSQQSEQSDQSQQAEDQQPSEQSQQSQQGQPSEQSQSGTPGEQGEQDEQADQGGESSGGEQNASQQAAEQTGRGKPQPGEQDQGGASSGSETAQAGADSTAGEQAGQTADAQQEPTSDAAGDQPGDERQEGVAGDQLTHDRQDATGEPRDSAERDGEGEQRAEQQTQGERQAASDGEGEQQADQQTQGEQQAASDRQGEQPQAAPDTSAEQTEDGKASQADRTADRGEDAGDAASAAGTDTQQAGAEQDAGQRDAAGGQQTAEGQDQTGPGDDRDGGEPTAAGPGQPPEGPAAQPGLADLMGDERARPRPQGPAMQMAEGNREDLQALEQMLRQVEDDPGGLLRQRFLLQHLRRSGQLP